MFLEGSLELASISSMHYNLKITSTMHLWPSHQKVFSIKYLGYLNFNFSEFDVLVLFAFLSFGENRKTRRGIEQSSNETVIEYLKTALTIFFKLDRQTLYFMFFRMDLSFI